MGAGHVLRLPGRFGLLKKNTKHKTTARADYELTLTCRVLSSSKLRARSTTNAGSSKRSATCTKTRGGGGETHRHTAHARVKGIDETVETGGQVPKERLLRTRDGQIEMNSERYTARYIHEPGVLQRWTKTNLQQRPHYPQETQPPAYRLVLMYARRLHATVLPSIRTSSIVANRTQAKQNTTT